MKILLVSPPFGEKGQKSKGLPIAPPVMEYLTGLTRQLRPDVQVSLLDANKEPFTPEDVEADRWALQCSHRRPRRPTAWRTG